MPESALPVKLMPHHGDVTKMVHQMGWEWVVEEECQTYLSGEAVVLTQAAADELLEAASAVYQMMVEAVPDDLPDDFLRKIGIPEKLWRAVRHSWNDERHWHIYGRFDFAQTPEGVKLLEFNADTATAIPETAVVQWASLAAAGKNESQQANGLYEGLVEQFRTWQGLNPELEPALLFIYMPDSKEDYTNCEVLAQAAHEAGFDTYICAAHEMQVSTLGAERGVWAQIGAEQWRKFPFLFKLVPWELFLELEPELCTDLIDLQYSRSVLVANPAYSLLFQSKGMLAWLWQQFPYHPLLLRTEFTSFSGKAVEKPIFGREGQNIQVHENTDVSSTTGDYGYQPHIYQAWAELPQDAQGYRYQAGVFWAGEGSAIGFRRERGIITNLSQFVAHVVE
ncbi:glutathionylspermidine synthase family protein [Rufibacter hautae]|uniref:Glutathionylspermidine synthase family protein n=1 Tax=Rufibacter hautae TaxID=2595005 RepID=A0A5B6TE39_9BACT|nr:glutathionylspermidine synthase family protein [Rufibacter hautae]KAA3437500.1 glutathionylspermidine synthase family protein [Rufibacter hautae]